MVGTIEKEGPEVGISAWKKAPSVGVFAFMLRTINGTAANLEAHQWKGILFF
jgi:hypothetical protein